MSFIVAPLYFTRPPDWAFGRNRPASRRARAGPRLGGSQYQTRRSCSPLTSNGATFIGIAPRHCIDFARQNLDLRRHLQSSVPSHLTFLTSEVQSANL